MNFLKCINFFLFNVCTIGLFSSQAISFSFKKDIDIEIFNFFKNEGIINSFKEIENDSVVVEFHQDWVVSFKKQRTKELELMLKEQKALQVILLENGILRTSENMQSIKLALESYKEIIPKRKKEEELNFEDFVFFYQNNLQALVEEIKNTRSRLCGIDY